MTDATTEDPASPTLPVPTMVTQSGPVPIKDQPTDLATQVERLTRMVDLAVNALDEMRKQLDDHRLQIEQAVAMASKVGDVIKFLEPWGHPKASN